MPVDTTKVEGRRNLDYQSFSELLADVDRLSRGPVKVLGNWSAGQIYRHLALIYNGSIDGYSITFPWYLRLAARLLRKKIIGSPMPPGFRLPPDGAASVEPRPASTEEGLAELQAAVARMEREDRRASHPIFGVMTREEWDRLHLKHASLHMSFLVPV
jgi:Protein of unknown function (DUF1569)